MNFKNKKLFILLGLFVLLPVVAWAAYPYTQNPYAGGYKAPWYFERFPQHILSGLFGGMLGAFFSQKLRKFRFWFFVLAMVVGALVGAMMSVALGNIAFFILGAAVGYFLLREEARAIGKRKATTFGSAEWADFDHLMNNGLIGDGGFTLGSYMGNSENYPICYTGDRHLLTVAPTRSGKGVSAIIPNLLRYEGSAIIIDPKGENAMITAARRGNGDEKLNIQGMGQQVHIVDPWGITGLPSSRFNPLDWLNPEDEDINENAMMLADSIVTPHAGNRDQFWDEEAKALLMGILLYVALDEREKENRTLGL